jgi:hypothetical protein
MQSSVPGPGRIPDTRTDDLVSLPRDGESPFVSYDLDTDASSEGRTHGVLLDRAGEAGALLAGSSLRLVLGSPLDGGMAAFLRFPG